MGKVDLARLGGRVPAAVAAFALLELALVAAGIAVLHRHAPWDAPRFAAFVTIEVAVIVAALTFNFAVLPGGKR